MVHKPRSEGTPERCVLAVERLCRGILGTALNSLHEKVFSVTAPNENLIAVLGLTTAFNKPRVFFSDHPNTIRPGFTVLPKDGFDKRSFVSEIGCILFLLVHYKGTHR